MKVLIYPRSYNPYHELLYKPLREAHPSDTFTYLAASPRNLVLFPFVVAAKRLQGYKVFHLHWHTFYLDAKYGIPGRKLISFVNTLVSLTVLKLLGYKLVWTVHNVLPHEAQTTNDALVARYTVRLASKVIIHSRQTIAELQAVGADTSKTVVNPHGNYEGVYPVTLTRAQARKKLTIMPHQTAVLLFGNLRPYKGIEQLLPAFAKLNLPDAKLILAGRCFDANLRSLIQDYALRHDTIIFVDGAIPDNKVAQYYLAADVACAPFQAVTTSGSVLLATTFGKPVVAPNLGAIRDIPHDAGIFYDPTKKGALGRALKQALTTSDLPAMAEASAAYSKTLRWDSIAAQTYQLYKDVV